MKPSLWLRKRLKAATLIEALLTLGIVFAVFGVACQLLNEYVRIITSAEIKASSLTTMQVALQQMLGDVRQASTVITPTGTTPDMDLKFLRTDPAANWAAKTPLVEVHYYLDPDGRLMRAAGPPVPMAVSFVSFVSLISVVSPVSPSSSDSWQVAERVAGFQAYRSTAGTVEIQITLVETRRTLVLNGSVLKPWL